jgi:hypothetical protein
MLEQKDYGKITETRKEMLTTYDVTDKRYCINERGNPIPDVFKAVVSELDSKYHDLLAKRDYFNIYPGRDDKCWPVDSDILVFYIKGASEGYYVHVETRGHEGNNLVFLAKTLREGEEGISWAEKMVCALSRIFKV